MAATAPRSTLVVATLALALISGAVQAQQVAEVLKPGYRAFTVRATIDPALAKILKVGSRVDVQTIVRDAKDAANQRAVSFLKDIEVLRIDRAKDGIVTLMVTPEQAERLYWVSSRTTVGLILHEPETPKKAESPKQ